ncbi:protein of unknown function [Magnetospirillum sp. XM-1]|nr:protein of unknown function [Magnetospirillum sp. XM-1]
MVASIYVVPPVTPDDLPEPLARLNQVHTLNERNFTALYLCAAHSSVNWLTPVRRRR